MGRSPSVGGYKEDRARKLYRKLYLISRERRCIGILRDRAKCCRRITRLTLSLACRLGIKPTWSLCIRLPIIGLRRKAKILARIFISTFSKEIGLKLDHTVLSVFGFRIIEISAVNVSQPKECCLSKALNVLVRRGASSAANFL